MRQNFKDKEYYHTLINEIRDEVQVILKEERNFVEKGNDYDEGFINMEIYGSQYLIFNLLYTSGALLENIVGDYNLMLSAYIKSIDPKQDLSDGGDLIYSELLNIISIGVILETNKIETKLCDLSKVLHRQNFADKLISLMLKNCDSKISKNLYWPKDEGVRQLIDAFESNNNSAIEKIDYYLDKVFYTKANLEDAFNAHKSNAGYTFSGYWSWEAGAIVKLMELDDSSFKDNPYYPYNLVHWKD